MSETTSPTWRWAVCRWDADAEVNRWETIDPMTFKSTGYNGNPQLVRADVDTFDDIDDDDGVVLSAGSGEYTPYRDPTNAELIAQAPDLASRLTDMTKLAGELAKCEEGQAAASLLTRARAAGLLEPSP